MARSDEWISPETHHKEADFAGLLTIHAGICRGIKARQGRPGDPPYLYVDLHAGPGLLRDDAGRQFNGSPLIALDTLARHGLDHETVHFEQDPDVAARLAAAIDPTTYPASTVCNSTFEIGANRWLQTVLPHSWRYGLVYADPIRDPMPVATFNDFAGHFPRVDLLAYVAANSHYKRTRASHGRRLEDDIAAIDKEHVLIREPETAHQWTFLLFTNWANFPEWERRGFHRLGRSGRGRDILTELNYSERERVQLANEALPFDNEPPYRSYREYLKHPKFLAVRAEVFRRAAGRCEMCKSRPPTEPHHLRYPPWGTFDVAENLLAICHQCHCQVHGKAS